MIEFETAVIKKNSEERKKKRYETVPDIGQFKKKSQPIFPKVDVKSGKGNDAARSSSKRDPRKRDVCSVAADQTGEPVSARSAAAAIVLVFF